MSFIIIIIIVIIIRCNFFFLQQISETFVPALSVLDWWSTATEWNLSFYYHIFFALPWGIFSMSSMWSEKNAKLGWFMKNKLQRQFNRKLKILLRKKRFRKLKRELFIVFRCWWLCFSFQSLCFSFSLTPIISHSQWHRKLGIVEWMRCAPTRKNQNEKQFI